MSSSYRSRNAISNALRRRVLERDGFRCRICGARGYAVDHIVARSLGGSDGLENLQTLCRSHHAAKTGREAQAARQGA